MAMAMTIAMAMAPLLAAALVDAVLVELDWIDGEEIPITSVYHGDRQ